MFTQSCSAFLPFPPKKQKQPNTQPQQQQPKWKPIKNYRENTKNNLERNGALASDVDAHETPLARLQSQFDEQSDRPENRCGRGPSSKHDTKCNSNNNGNGNNDINARKMHSISG